MTRRTSKIKIAIVASNYMKIDRFTKKGTEIFVHILSKALYKYQRNKVVPTVYTSGNSKVFWKTASIMYKHTNDNKQIGNDNHIMFELALIAKAISEQNNYDLFHFNIGNGEFILPFARYIKKPIVITMHNSSYAPYNQKYFPLFKHLKNVHFVSISKHQKKGLPYLNYIATIPHAVDTENIFTFDPNGGDSIIWTGRAVPEKGLDVALSVARKVKKKTRIFPIIKEEYLSWLHEEVIKKRDLLNQIFRLHIDFNVNRNSLASEYQRSKLFLFPLQWEEPFGLTVIEALACGTPVVSYAYGSLPEIVEDGKTGFLVNPSPTDIRGNWTIKKTGIDGLIEAVQKIYSMSDEAYRKLRYACRKRAEQIYNLQRLSDDYMNVYRHILKSPNANHQGHS